MTFKRSLTDLELLQYRPTGREQLVQRLLTRLVLGADVPEWNQRRTPSPMGRRFLDALDQRCFGVVDPTGADFVNEFELPSSDPQNEPAGWPDYAIIRAHRLVLVELKTEPGSHRPDQLPRYQALSRVHYPNVARDTVYVTPKSVVSDVATHDGERYAHVHWEDVKRLIADCWKMAGDDTEHRLAERLMEIIDQVEQGIRHIPTGESIATAPVSAEAMMSGLCLAAETQKDGEQRALEIEVESPEELDQIRAGLVRALRERPVIGETPITHVEAWWWRRSTSGGQALTKCGERHGYEIRFSRYKR